MFVNQASDPIVERLQIPDLALAVAERFAVEESKRVLVLLTDMTAYADAMKELGISMEQVPSNRGYMGDLYSKLAKRYEKASDFKGAGSVTILTVTTMPGNDVTHPVPDNTGYITEGQFYLHSGVIDPFGSLSRLKQHVIGKVTREDHGQIMNTMVRFYSEARDAEQKQAMAFELSAFDHKLLKFGRLFRRALHGHPGLDAAREALDRGWETLAECFEPHELLMKQELIDKYFPRKELTMARLALSKSSLQKERKKLANFEKFLPSLDLKRRQLMAERAKAVAELAEAETALTTFHDGIGELLPMLSNREVDLDRPRSRQSLAHDEENVVGIRLPRLVGLRRRAQGLFAARPARSGWTASRTGSKESVGLHAAGALRPAPRRDPEPRRPAHDPAREPLREGADPAHAGEHQEDPDLSRRRRARGRRPLQVAKKKRAAGAAPDMSIASHEEGRLHRGDVRQGRALEALQELAACTSSRGPRPGPPRRRWTPRRRRRTSRRGKRCAISSARRLKRRQLEYEGRLRHHGRHAPGPRQPANAA